MMPLWIRLLFFGAFLILSGLMVVYLYRRLVRDVTTHPKLRLSGAAILIGLAGGALAARTAFRGSGMAQPLALFLGLWIGLVLYTLLSVVVVDLVRGVNKLRTSAEAPVSSERRQFLSRAFAAGSVVSGAGLASWGTWRAYEPPQIHEVPVRLPGLPKALEGFSIVQLSDLHVGAILQQAFVDDLVTRANALKPDLLAITGDLVDGKPSEIGGFISRFGNLQSKHGTYFCSGRGRR